jgi:hypothetical protein
MTGLQPVAVASTGLIGRAWAIAFTRAGLEVRLWYPNAAAKGFVREVVEDLAAADLLSGRNVENVLASLVPCLDLTEALANVAWVQECGPEVIAVKRETFARLDALAPAGAILASSSSALLPSDRRRAGRRGTLRRRPTASTTARSTGAAVSSRARWTRRRKAPSEPSTAWIPMSRSRRSSAASSAPTVRASRQTTARSIATTREAARSGPTTTTSRQVRRRTGAPTPRST